MGGLLHVVQRGGDWAGPQPAPSPPCCTKISPPSVPITVLLCNNVKNFRGSLTTLVRTSDLTDFQNAFACKGYTSVLSKMVSVIFAVLVVSFWALTTVVKLPLKFLTLIFAVLLQLFCCAMLCKRGLSRHAVSVRLSALVSYVLCKISSS